jgi:hypothetical protein
MKGVDMSRFESIKFDKSHLKLAEKAAALSIEVERFISELHKGRSSAMAITHLEECHVWMGKAIRDDQIIRGRIDD